MQKARKGQSALVKDSQICGWLYKWTNYIRGYRQRWFVLTQDGTLEYYRSQMEVNRLSRGGINMVGAIIHAEDSTNFVVCGGTQTFHLKAKDERERQRWITQLELAKHRAIKRDESEEEEERHLETTDDKDIIGELESKLRHMEAKMEDIDACKELLVKNGSSLQKGVAELETASRGDAEDAAGRAKVVNERATLYVITANAMSNAMGEFFEMARATQARWQRLLAHEREQREQLQQQIEKLARQHSLLENLAMSDRRPEQLPRAMTLYSDDDEEGDGAFHDAAEDVDELMSRQADGSSGSSSGGGASDSAASLRRSASAVSADADQTAALFDAEIVSARSSSGADVENGPPTPEQQLKRPTSGRQRRTSIAPRPNHSLNLWSILRNCVGKELTKIPLPVNFNEPLSLLQRLAEDLEYSDIVDRAAAKTDSTEQLCYVAAFTVSVYASTSNRTSKPFNPLLGETYEMDRLDDLRFRSVAEQVSHHPPVAAQHTHSENGWTLEQEFSLTSKFRGKYLSVTPRGCAHLAFDSSGNHYTWHKVTTTVHNIIFGRLWIDNHGETTIVNHTTGDKCLLKYTPYSYFSNETPRKVTGVVQDKAGVVRWVLQGTWDDHMDYRKVIGGQSADVKTHKVFETLPPRRIWKRNDVLPDADKRYNFSRLSMELNEPEEGVAPTDSRRRPDQRLMEDGAWHDANAEKLRLEDKQRAVRRRVERQTEKALAAGLPVDEYEPLWFKKATDDKLGGVIHKFTDSYWDAKSLQQWEKCPDIY